MPSRAVTARIFSLAVLLAAAPAFGQADEALPDLTPRAFEIRGDLQISLPNLERQPLRFAPPPRTYVVPGNRRTYVAPYRQSLDGLPADGLATPAPPEASTLSPLTGRIDAAFGRYLSRLGRLTLSAGGFGVDAAYSGYSSFAPDALAGAEDDAMANAFEGQIGYTSPGPVRFGGTFGGTYDRYTLIGAPALGVTDRTGRTVGGEAFVEADVPDGVPFDLRIGLISTDITLEDDVANLFPNQDADLTEFRVEAGGAVNAQRVRLDAHGAFSGLGDEGLGESLTTYAAGGAFRLGFGRGRLLVGGRLLGYSASDVNGGGSSVTGGPVVDLDIPLSSTTHLFARTEPRSENGSLADLFRENPYAVPTPLVAPDLHAADGEAGLELQTDRVRLVAFGGAQYSPVRRYFEQAEAGVLGGLYEARYGEALVVRGGGTLTLYAPSGLRVTVGAEARSGRLVDADRNLPYFAPVAGRLSAALPFAGERGLVQVTGTAESARPTNVDGVDADAWATLDAEARYLFTPNIGLLVRAERIAGRAEQWPGFPRPPAAVQGGLRVRW